MVDRRWRRRWANSSVEADIGSVGSAIAVLRHDAEVVDRVAGQIVDGEREGNRRRRGPDVLRPAGAAVTSGGSVLVILGRVGAVGADRAV